MPFFTMADGDNQRAGQEKEGKVEQKKCLRVELYQEEEFQW